MVGQLAKYGAYMRDPAALAAMGRSHLESCRTLTCLHAMARTAGGSPVPELGPLVKRVADGGTPPCMDPVPRLLVFGGAGISRPGTLATGLDMVREQGFTAVFVPTGSIVLAGPGEV